MLKKWKFNLQLFADGGDGGSSAGEASGESAGEEIPSTVPARARDNYAKALKANKASLPKETEADVPTTETTEEVKKPTYEELINSDDYKNEHQAYVQKAIEKRLKNHQKLADKQHSILSLVASKYDLDESSETFLADLETKVKEDDSFYERYALEHDTDTQTARKIVTLERQVAENERVRAEQEQMAAQRAEIDQIIRNAEKTKAIYPNFDINEEIKNPNFARLLKVLNGDTTTAYRTTHWDELMHGTVSQAIQTANMQTANAVKANKSRPVENGLGSSAPSVSTQEADFSRMNLQQLRAWAAEQNRLKSPR